MYCTEGGQLWTEEPSKRKHKNTEFMQQYLNGFQQADM